MLDDDLAREAECRLVTTGRASGEPREITIWFAGAGDRVYLLSGGGDAAHWVRNLQVEPRVVVRVGGRAFEGRAAVVTDAGDPDDGAARAAIAAKYGTTGLKTWLRTALPVVIALERERGPEADRPPG